MERTQAAQCIKAGLERMRTVAGDPVFDEWILFRWKRRAAVTLDYAGPRPDSIGRELPRDLAPLADELSRGGYAPGHFFFSREAEGALFDAFMAVGPNTYAVFNNTDKSMDEVTLDPAWKVAQVAFVELSETFRADPLR